MCIALVLLSLIPILSGYFIYLGVTTFLAESSAALQITVSVLGVLTTLAALRQLWCFLVRRYPPVTRQDK